MKKKLSLKFLSSKNRHRVHQHYKKFRTLKIIKKLNFQNYSQQNYKFPQIKSRNKITSIITFDHKNSPHLHLDAIGTFILNYLNNSMQYYSKTIKILQIQTA